MEKDIEITEVIFRKDNSGVFAIFPYEIHNSHFITTYQHVGQHSSGDYDYCMKSSKPATEEEYIDLFDELKSIGYDLKIIKKRNYNKYLKEYYDNNKM